MTPQSADTICMLVAAILPVPLVLRWNRLGVALGALVVWGAGVLAGYLLSRLDPGREGGMLDGLWVQTGWVFGLLYALSIWLAKRVVLGLWQLVRKGFSPSTEVKAAQQRVSALILRLRMIRFSVRGMMIAVAVAAFLLLIERWLFVLAMSAHTDATWAERVAALAWIHIVGLGILGLVWLWRRFARYD